MNSPTSGRICKYHGRTCEHPGACLNRSPRKYEGDGTLETIDPDRLTIGNVVRMNHRDGMMPAFSDSVVIGIKVAYGGNRRKTERVDHSHHVTLAEALAHAKQDDYIMVILARPYMYASNPFASMPNFLQGAEKYEAHGKVFTDTHKVVVMSTGEYATFLSSPLLHSWQVVTNKEGEDNKVFDDLDPGGAKATYNMYRQMSQGAFGQKVGFKVTLLCDGEVVDEYPPKGV